MRFSVFLTAFFLTLSVSACADPQPSDKPLPHTILVIDTTAGEAKFDVEVAADWRSQEYGLMNRRSLPRNTGMIFDFHSPSMASFWMKNTVLSLDLVFIGPDHRVINVAANAVPYSEDSIVSDAPAIATLELNAGRARELNIVPGAKVDW